MLLVGHHYQLRTDLFPSFWVDMGKSAKLKTMLRGATSVTWYTLQKIVELTVVTILCGNLKNEKKREKQKRPGSTRLKMQCLCFTMIIEEDGDYYPICRAISILCYHSIIFVGGLRLEKAIGSPGLAQSFCSIFGDITCSIFFLVLENPNQRAL